jgi:hypothetical protein
MVAQRRLVALVVVLLTSAPLGVAATERIPVRTQSDFLYDLIDLNRLPFLDTGVDCRQFSSYDRRSNDMDNPEAWRANGDAGQYISVDGNEGLMAEMDGPGCIVRIWSANPQGRIRIYFDGELVPRVDMPFADMFNDSTPPFLSPVCGYHGAGANCYLPMPFRRSCRVVAVGEDGPPMQYYHIGYKTFTKDTRLASFSPRLSAEAQRTLEDVRVALSNCGSDPQPLPPHTHTMSYRVRVKPGERRTILTGAGPTIIDEIRMSWEARSYLALRNVLLQIFWDDETQPSVDCPLGDFFGTGPGTNPYRSLPLGMDYKQMYSFWRMPYRRGARIDLVNQGGYPVSIEYTIRYHFVDSLPSNTGYFHAKWRREAPCHTFDYPFLEAKGWGRYCGAMLTVHNLETYWWGEGDEKVWVDGEKFPSTFGTGSEDYFGDAWGFRHFVHAFHGNTLGQGPGFSNKWSVYRWHISDDIPFDRDLRITIENYGDAGDARDYSSVAYWYQMHGGKDFFATTPLEQRTPWPLRVAGAVEIEDLVVGGVPTGCRIVTNDDMPAELSGGQGLAYERPMLGRTAIITIPADEARTYQLFARCLQLPSGGQFRALYHDDPIGEPVDTYAPLPGATTVKLGQVRLAEGDNAIAFEIVGRRAESRGFDVVLDTLEMVPAVAENAIEAEALEVVANDTGGGAGTQDMTGFGRGWSGDAQLFITARHHGSVTVRLPVTKECDYVLSVYFTKAPDYGIVQVALDARDIGAPFDGYSEAVIPSGRVELGRVHVTAGDHELTFRITGKSEKSVGYFAGVDCVTLEAP